MKTTPTSERITTERMPARVASSAGERTSQRSPEPALDWIAPAALSVLLLIAAWYQGAFALRHWAPVALLALVMLTAAAATGGLTVPERAGRIALVALWGFAAWALLSVLWAESPGRAVEGAGRTVLYAALFTVPCAMTWTGRSAARVGALLMAGIGVIAAVTFVEVLADPNPLFLAGRLDDPVGYRNATACLFALGFWPFVAAAAHWGLGAVVRAVAFGAAALVLGLAFLTQARGVALGLALGGVVALGLGPDRLRRACCALVLLGGVAAASNWLLAPYDAFLDAGDAGTADIAEAVDALVLLVLAALGLGLLGALLDGGLRLRGRARLVARRSATAAVAVAAVAAVAGTLVAIGNPVDFASDRYDEFEQLETSAPGESRLTFGGGQRADLWRIALLEFREDPLTGSGEGSYPFRYYEERRTDRNLSTPHSLPFRVIGELGLIGIVCLVGFLAALCVAVAGRWRHAEPGARWWASALLAVGAVGLGQAAVDWIWLIPGVVGICFLALGLGIAALRPAGGERPIRPALPVRLVGAAAGVILVALVTLLYLGDVYVRKARATEAVEVSKRLDSARTAETLNPWSTVPHHLQAGALEDMDRRGEARAELREAMDLEPRNFVTYALLGDLEVRAGRVERGQRLYRRALALNPRDIGLRKLSRREFGP
jgi:tetratricopeptide (TPR) repeat protein